MMMKKLTLTVTVIVIGIAALCSESRQDLVDKTTKEICLQRINEWSKRVRAILSEDSFSSVIGERILKINELDRKLIVPLGPKVLPYLIVMCQENWWIGSSILMITKFEAHNIVLNLEPQNLLSTTEEFPQIVERNISYDGRKIFLFWWLEGERQTPQWFVERYSKWIAAKRQGNNQLAQGMYQKLLNIGIAAIPLWLQKLEIEQDEGIKKDILNALSYLTDGEVKATMSVQDCLNWWRENKERWTIPFPKSKKAFLEWLEKEGWEEPRLTVPCVITISRLEEEEAIEALLRFLRHPSPLVRAVSLKQIMKLFGEQLPKEYALGVGTDEWESYGDLVEMGKENLVRKRMMEAIGKVEDKKQAEKVADDLSNWWQSKKGKVTIYWRRAWENL